MFAPTLEAKIELIKKLEDQLARLYQRLRQVMARQEADARAEEKLISERSREEAEARQRQAEWDAQPELVKQRAATRTPRFGAQGQAGVDLSTKLWQELTTSAISPEVAARTPSGMESLLPSQKAEVGGRLSTRAMLGELVRGISSLRGPLGVGQMMAETPPAVQENLLKTPFIIARMMAEITKQGGEALPGALRWMGKKASMEELRRNQALAKRREDLDQLTKENVFEGKTPAPYTEAGFAEWAAKEKAAIAEEVRKNEEIEKEDKQAAIDAASSAMEFIPVLEDILDFKDIIPFFNPGAWGRIAAGATDADLMTEYPGFANAVQAIYEAPGIPLMLVGGAGEIGHLGAKGVGKGVDWLYGRAEEKQRVADEQARIAKGIAGPPPPFPGLQDTGSKTQILQGDYTGAVGDQRTAMPEPRGEGVYNQWQSELGEGARRADRLAPLGSSLLESAAAAPLAKGTMSGMTDYGVVLHQMDIAEIEPWTEKMVERYGEGIRPHIPKLWKDTGRKWNKMLDATSGQMPHFNELLENFHKGKWNTNWYDERGVKDIIAFHGLRDAPLMLQLYAITSQNTQMAGNYTFALKAKAQIDAGMPITEMRYGKIADDINRMLAGEEYASTKVRAFVYSLAKQDPRVFAQMPEFIRNLTETAVADMWHSLEYRLERKKTGKPGQITPMRYGVIAEGMRETARQTGTSVEEAQAARWAGVQEKLGASEPGVSYGDLLHKDPWRTTGLVVSDDVKATYEIEPGKPLFMKRRDSGKPVTKVSYNPKTGELVPSEGMHAETIRGNFDDFVRIIVDPKNNAAASRAWGTREFGVPHDVAASLTTQQQAFRALSKAHPGLRWFPEVSNADLGIRGEIFDAATLDPGRAWIAEDPPSKFVIAVTGNKGMVDQVPDALRKFDSGEMRAFDGNISEVLVPGVELVAKRPAAGEYLRQFEPSYLLEVVASPERARAYAVKLAAEGKQDQVIITDTNNPNGTAYVFELPDGADLGKIADALQRNGIDGSSVDLTRGELVILDLGFDEKLEEHATAFAQDVGIKATIYKEASEYVDAKDFAPYLRDWETFNAERVVSTGDAGTAGATQKAGGRYPLQEKPPSEPLRRKAAATLAERPGEAVKRRTGTSAYARKVDIPRLVPADKLEQATLVTESGPQVETLETPPWLLSYDDYVARATSDGSWFQQAVANYFQRAGFLDDFDSWSESRDFIESERAHEILVIAGIRDGAMSIQEAKETGALDYPEVNELFARWIEDETYAEAQIIVHMHGETEMAVGGPRMFSPEWLVNSGVYDKFPNLRKKFQVTRENVVERMIKAGIKKTHARAVRTFLDQIAKYWGKAQGRPWQEFYGAKLLDLQRGRDTGLVFYDFAGNRFTVEEIAEKSPDPDAALEGMWYGRVKKSAGPIPWKKRADYASAPGPPGAAGIGFVRGHYSAATRHQRIGVREAAAVIRLFETGQIQTLVHEFGHLIRTILADGDLAHAEKLFDVENGKWVSRHEEAFANAFVRYVMDGISPTPRLAKVFERIKTWLRDVYNAFKAEGFAQASIPEGTDPRVRMLFDRVMGATPIMEKPKPPTLLKPSPPYVQAKLFHKDVLTHEERVEYAPHTVSLRKAEAAAIRKRLKFDALDKPEREGFAAAWDEAARTGLADDIMAIARGAVEAGRALEPAEHAAAVQKYIQLEDALTSSRKAMDKAVKAGKDSGVEMEIGRMMSILDEIDALTEATDAAGTAAGRALAIRRLRADRDTFSLAQVVRAAQKSKGSKITVERVQWYEKRIAELEGIEKRLAEETKRAEKLQRERDKVLAQRVADIERMRSEKSARAEGVRRRRAAERADIEKQLAAMGNRMTSVVGPPTDALYLLGKLAVSHIRDGASSLNVVVDRIREKFPDITERDVWEALGTRSAAAQQRARTEVENNLSAFTTEARLRRQIDDLLKGVTPQKGERTARLEPEHIKELRKKLHDLQAALYQNTAIPADRLQVAQDRLQNLRDQLYQGWRPIRKKKAPVPPDVEAIRKEISIVERTIRSKDVLADLNEQKRTGNYKPTQKRAPAMTPELETLQIQKKRVRREIKEAIERERGWTAGRIYEEAVNTLRTAKATADISATLRQGLVATLTDPIGAAKDQGAALKAMFSKHTDEEIDVSLRNSPNYDLYERSGLELTELGGRLNEKEEMFMSSLLEHERAKVIKDIVGASERHMRTYLNLRRANLFDRFLEANPNATDVELKAMADWINVHTGRGNIPGGLKGASKVMSAVFFAPRFAVSRIQTPLMLWKYRKLPRVRKAIAKDLVRTAAFGISMLSFAAAAGADVELDPRSPDFGKIKIGNTRIDLWGGLQQPIRLVLRIGAGAAEQAGWLKKGKGRRDIDPIDLITTFGRYKLGPGIALPVELYTGKTAVGEKRKRWESLLHAGMPLVVEDIWDAYQDSGLGRAAWVAPAVLSGVGVMTYGKKKGSEEEIRREFMRRQGLMPKEEE